MDITKVNAIRHWHSPRNLEELQIFLGLAGFFRKYVQHHIEIADPMTNQLKEKGKTFTWAVAQQDSFDMMATLPILAIVNTTKPFIVEINGSDRAIGAILLQEGKPIAFESKKLDQAQFCLLERTLCNYLCTSFVWS